MTYPQFDHTKINTRVAGRLGRRKKVQTAQVPSWLDRACVVAAYSSKFSSSPTFSRHSYNIRGPTQLRPFPAITIIAHHGSQDLE